MKFFKRGLMKRVLAVLCCLAGFSGTASAQYLETKDLARMCLSDKKEQMSACINYVAGVVDYHTLMQSFGTAPTIDFCLPPEVSKEQAAVIVMAYLKTVTENDEFTAAATIPLALNKAFPCHQYVPTVHHKKKHP